MLVTYQFKFKHHSSLTYWLCLDFYVYGHCYHIVLVLLRLQFGFSQI